MNCARIVGVATWAGANLTTESIRLTVVIRVPRPLPPDIWEIENLKGVRATPLSYLDSGTDDDS